jgi:4-aminobutyrate aminotransferase-like enzyme
MKPATGYDLPKIKTNIPGPKSKRLARQLFRYECPNITSPSPIFWERTKGANVTDVDGNRYVDLTGGFAVANAGHSNPKIIHLLIQQAQKLSHSLGDVHPAQIKVELLQALSRTFPEPRAKTFLACSGSEAVEIALKTAFLFTGKPGVIAFQGAYHGLTYGALSVTSMLEFNTPFKSQMNLHTYHVPYPTSYPKVVRDESILENIESLIRNKPIGAILIEPIQGRGGIRIAPFSFLKSLRKLCTEHKLALIVDEIFSGAGRTSKFFAFEHSGIVPDLVTLGKGLSGGFPISACIGTSKIMAAWPRHHGEALHTSTFMGNPMGCAMALASLTEIYRGKLDQKAKNLGEQWLKKLTLFKEQIECVGDIRGLGLMIGIEIVEKKVTAKADTLKARRIAENLLKRGLILLSDGVEGNVLSITPPLTITQRQMNYSAEIIEKCLRKLKI